MMKALLLVFALAFTGSGAMAQQQATPVNGDTRLVTFNYDPDQTYLILVRPRTMTHIQLRADEKVVTLGAGDTSNFTFVVSANKSNVLIRPKYADLTTSMTLITTERSYPIMLRSTDESTGKWYQRVTWNIDEQLVMDLPTPAAVPARPTPSIGQAEDPQVQPVTGSTLTLNRINLDYTVEGVAPFAPSHVFDDGVRTFLRMPENLEVLPALFGLTDGSDGRVLNYTVDKQYIVVQGTHPALLLKLGRSEVKVARGKKPNPLSRLFGGNGG